MYVCMYVCVCVILCTRPFRICCNVTLRNSQLASHDKKAGLVLADSYLLEADGDGEFSSACLLSITCMLVWKTRCGTVRWSRS